MQADERHPIEVLAEEFAQRMRSGESPSIDEYVAQLPEHADLLRQVLTPILAMERIGSSELSKRQFDSQTHRLAKHHPQLGDFRIVRQIGRGGMGVVYEAVQLSLNRRVALKVLAPGIADSPDEFRRFQLEATAVAQLHHTNIVPIFGVGEAEGLHFYAMQFIDGLTLADAISRLSQLERIRGRATADNAYGPGQATSEVAASPLSYAGLQDGVETQVAADIDGLSGAKPDTVAKKHAQSPNERPVDQHPSGFRWEQCKLVQSFDQPSHFVREVAALGHALADALAHAHQQGIIHRDIKPGNLLIDHQSVWLTDFGVAKLSSEATLTRTGMLLGTLRYMAPEQFAGEADPRSDIYSLGLTLLELLTLKPVFEKLTQAHLVQAKATAEVTTQGLLLRRCPRDLATIVLKACASEPTARYATAADLADDLQRFLDDRPIRAQRASSFERLVRWGRRQPLVAALTATVAVSLVALASVFAVGNYRLNLAIAELQQSKEAVEANVAAKTEALEIAEKQRRLASGNLSMAIEAFEEIMQNVGSRGGAESLSVEWDEGEVAYGASVVSEADAEVLQTLLQFFERFSAENAMDLSAETAAAQRRTGDVLSRLGRPEEARSAYQQALALYDRLLAKDSVLQESRDLIDVERLRLYNALALNASQQGNLDQSLAYYRELAAIYRSFQDNQQSRSPRAVEESKFEFARGLNAKNSIIVRMGIAPERRQSRDAESSGGSNVRLPMAIAREAMGERSARRLVGSLANVVRQIHREAKSNNQTAIELLSELCRLHPTRVDYALELAHAYREQARLARNELDQTAAADAYRNALHLMERLLDEHPESPYLRFVYADAVTTLAPPQARRVGAPIARALQIANALVKEYPQVPDYVALKAKTLLMRNDPLAINQAIDLLSGLIEDYPAMLHYRVLLANALARSSNNQQEGNDLAAARESLERAIRVLTNGIADADLPWMVSLNVERLKERIRSLEEIPNE